MIGDSEEVIVSLVKNSQSIRWHPSILKAGCYPESDVRREVMCGVCIYFPLLVYLLKSLPDLPLRCCQTQAPLVGKAQQREA